MKKLFLIAALAALGYVGFRNCGGVESKSVAFQGSWIRVVENGIAGTEDRTTIKVITDGERFHITSESTDEFTGATSQHFVAYDGTSLRERHVSPEFSWEDYGNSEDSFESEDSQSTDSGVEERSASPGQVRALQFWRTFEPSNASAGAGGDIAGRATRLFQMRENRPDATGTIQRWLDAETGVLLKSVSSIFAKQVDSLLTKDTYECTSIAYGAVDPAVFSAP